MSVLTPDEAIAEGMRIFHQDPVFITGSCVAAETYGLTEFNDLDVFVPSKQVLISSIQKLIDRGATMDDRTSRVWYRWLRYGLKGWHTNSLKLETTSGLEINVVYKIIDGHPTTSLGQVVESFDFGLLGMGYDVEHGVRRDYRSALFPDINLSLDPDQDLDMMPGKRENWRRGYINKYQGIRQPDRYTRYYEYGHGMSKIKSSLIEGYRNAVLYYSAAFDEEKKQLGVIFDLIADHLENDNIDGLKQAYKVLDFNDSLDAIYDALV
jgi:hypothetical protein